MVQNGQLEHIETISQCGITTEKVEQSLEGIFGKAPSCADIIAYFPSAYQLQLPSTQLAQVPHGSKVIVNVVSVSHSGQHSYRRNFGRKQVYQIAAITDGKEPIQLMFFKIFPSQIERFAVGKMNTISGRLEITDGQYRIAHPQIETKPVKGIMVITRWSALQPNNEGQKDDQQSQAEQATQQKRKSIWDDDDQEEKRAKMQKQLLLNATSKSAQINIEPTYRLPKGVKKETYLQIVENCIERLKQKLETIPCHGQEGLEEITGTKKPNLLGVFSLLHKPTNIECLKRLTEMKRCLGAFEIAANKIAISIADAESKKATKEPITPSGKLRQEIIGKMPFELTKDQQRTIEEITKDQSKTSKSYRLVQGDVGSGKTAIALAAMLNAVEHGKSAIMMAPTTVLATQHYRFVADITFGTNIPVFLLTGKTKASERKKIQTTIESGTPSVIIGTHAIIESQYIQNCGICVIDEQHRFGVQQRQTLAESNPMADIIMMTATPIPRTMLSIIYDSVEISYIKEMPKSRKPIITSVMAGAKTGEVMQHLASKVKEGVKAYWICPAVEMTEEESNLTSTEERFEQMQQCLPKDQLFVMHGKLKESQKDEIMLNFASSKTGALLIATSVIEVGINVPEATIIVIEQAERFGLSQLHQLRGRVGRGHQQSYCLLVYSTNAPSMSIQKLSVLKNSTDGFVISEEDFKMRGGGDIIGVRQSGYSNFKIAGEQMDSQLLMEGRDIAQSYLGQIRPTNNTAEENNQKTTEVKNLLNIFGYTDQIFKKIRN